MKIVIQKKGVVDCTSDPRHYSMQTWKEGIEAAMKIIDSEVVDMGHARFDINEDSEISEGGRLSDIIVHDIKTCMKLLNYFKNHANELKNGSCIYISVNVWNFFNEGGNCSDYIEIYHDRLEVSCQDWYDDDMRMEFHDHIEDILGSDYVVAIDDTLISLHVNITEKCSANCDTCYINRGLGRELEKDDWANLPKAEQYAIGGGEPAEYPLIAEFVDYLKEKGVYVAITTNGQKIIEFNKHSPDKIAVSIDGLTQDEHSKTHNTDLEIAKKVVETYASKGIEVCINHIVHRENIHNTTYFTREWNDKGHQVNLILFLGKDDLKPTFEQLISFEHDLDEKIHMHSIADISNTPDVTIDSCMAGVLEIIDGNYKCQQGLYSKCYRFGAITPCSHSHLSHPNCKVMEDYFMYFFRTLRPLVFVYNKDGTSGAHEWAFKLGYQGKVRHKIDVPLRKDTIYILTHEEAISIRENNYIVHFDNKMPYWIHHVKC